MRRDQVLEFLQGVSLLSDAAPALLELIDSDPRLQLELKSLRRGQMVRDSYHQTNYVGVLATGQIDVYAIAPGGTEVLLNSLYPGNMFGVANLFSEHDLSCVLVCRKSAQIILIPKEALRQLTETNLAFSKRLFSFLNDRLNFLVHRVEALTLVGAKTRLSAYLESHADTQGRVELPGSREDLARYLGISRSALFRELKSLREQGCIATEQGAIVLCDR